MLPPRDAGQYRNPVYTGPPSPPPPRRKVWPQLAAFLLVSAVAVATFMALFHYLARDAQRAREAADASPTVVAISQEQCHGIRVLYGRWLDSKPPITREETQELTTKTAAAAFSAGRAFASALQSYADVAPELLAAIGRYDSAMAALKDALVAGQATPADVDDAWSAGGHVHQLYEKIQYSYSCS